MKKFVSNIIQAILTVYAKGIIKRFKPEIMVISGSMAKTTTKEMVFAALKHKFNGEIKCTPGNLNTSIGISLAFLGYDKQPSLWMWPGMLISFFFRYIFMSNFPKFYIIEIGADKPGDIKAICSYLKPKYGIITAIGPAHEEIFGSIDAIVKEKSEIIKDLPIDGAAFINQNDEKKYKLSEYTKAKVVFFDSPISEISVNIAMSVGKYFGLSETVIKESFKDAPKESSRFSVYNLKENILLLDDSYNANPLSMKGAIEYFENILSNKSGRKIAILGDMLELGEKSKEYHTEIGKLIDGKFDLVFSVGKASSDYNSNRHFQNVAEIIPFILNEIKTDDNILVKGSRGIKLDLLAKEIKNKFIGVDKV
ncbi:MAG: Mur ligase family protein [Patescibacteria group bacterium]|jgi:UDP-N-acetylmuramoyl-tripeptide--D-alanyl-D-alanine ligase